MLEAGSAAPEISPSQESERKSELREQVEGGGGEVSDSDEDDRGGESRRASVLERTANPTVDDDPVERDLGIPSITLPSPQEAQHRIAELKKWAAWIIRRMSIYLRRRRLGGNSNK